MKGSFDGDSFISFFFENCRARYSKCICKIHFWNFVTLDPGSRNLAHQYWWLFPKTRYPCLSCFLRHDPAPAGSLSILQIFVTSHNSDPISINNTHTICRNFRLQIFQRNFQHTICLTCIYIYILEKTQHLLKEVIIQLKWLKWLTGHNPNLCSPMTPSTWVMCWLAWN